MKLTDEEERLWKVSVEYRISRLQRLFGLIVFAVVLIGASLLIHQYRMHQ